MKYERKYKHLWSDFYEERLKILFPSSINIRTSSNFFNFGLKKLKKLFRNDDDPWLLTYKNSTRKIPNKIPEEGMSPEEIISMSIEEFFPGAPNWRSPKLQYNICAPLLKLI